MKTISMIGAGLLAAASQMSGADPAWGSSHREAPFITQNPKVDATDFYLFRSYEPGREEFVTLIANYQPFQDPFGGPNYYSMDPEALYEIHVDSDGDAVEDLTFRFRFDQELASGDGLTIPVGPEGMTKDIRVPVINLGPISAVEPGFDPELNRRDTYTLDVVRGDRRTGQVQEVSRSDGETRFEKPVDNIGLKSIPDYEAYAAAHLYDIDIPGCDAPAGQSARVFVGQRDESFVISVGQIFDLINLDDPLGPRDQGLDDLDEKSITTLALEVPASCLNDDADAIIGAWTSASVRQARVINPTPTFERPAREGGPWAQVSRLGMPLVNEVVIGLADKNLFNASEPVDDAQFLDYVTHPTLPEIVEILFGAAGVVAPNEFPRSDLVAVFLTGVENVNMTATPAEMQRLNTAIPPTPRAEQSSLGAAQCFTEGTLDLDAPGCDPAGFPNGRRPGDDVVDIALRVVMGFLLPRDVAPSGSAPFTDGALVSATDFDAAFPYLVTPLPGSEVD